MEAEGCAHLLLRPSYQCLLLSRPEVFPLPVCASCRPQRDHFLTHRPDPVPCLWEAHLILTGILTSLLGQLLLIIKICF